MAKKSQSGQITIYMNVPLFQTAKEFVSKHPTEQSVSKMLERLLDKHLRPRVRKYGLKMPDNSVAQPLA